MHCVPYTSDSVAFGEQCDKVTANGRVKTWTGTRQKIATPPPPKIPEVGRSGSPLTVRLVSRQFRSLDRALAKYLKIFMVQVFLGKLIVTQKFSKSPLLLNWKVPCSFRRDFALAHRHVTPHAFTFSPYLSGSFFYNDAKVLQFFKRKFSALHNLYSSPYFIRMIRSTEM